MERKLATVLFVDLVSSTELVTDVDPEIVRRRVSRFFDQVSHCIVTHGGTVEKFAGDAVMAAFGVPLAHEDDAERAVRAGLATLDRVRELGLEARVGIESGEVVADESESTFATGEPVNLAARLQQEAAPNEILVGPATARLVRDRVELERSASSTSAAGASPSPRTACSAPSSSASRCSASPRRSSAASPSSSCWRTPTSARCATSAPRSSRSTATPASARAGSRASSSPGSKARRFSPAAACRTAKASRTGRSPRW